MRSALQWIAEQRIQEAIEAGELDNLPGMGKPLRLEEEHDGDPEMRLAFTVLKMAGFLPFQMSLRKEIEVLQREAVRPVHNCRLAVQRYANLLAGIYHDLHRHFGGDAEVRAFLGIKALPAAVETAIHSAPPPTRKVRKRDVPAKRESWQQLTRAYDRAVKRYRANYQTVLEKINERVWQLKDECVKEEVRRRKPLASDPEHECVDVAGKLQAFDHQFERFEAFG